MPRITGARTIDVRFPTSRQLDGSDAMNSSPDYSAAYVCLETDQTGLEGCGITFTIGRGNELTHLKFKVGGDLEQDRHRLAIVREEIGADRHIMIDANQVWEVDQTIDWVSQLSEFRPLFIEEPTSPDDVLGHKRIREAIRPIGVATGEHCQNRILFKQFF